MPAAPVAKVTKDTVTVKGASAPMYGLNFDPDTVMKSKSQIWFWTGCDHKHKLFEKLASEWQLCPLVNYRLKEDIAGLLDKTNRIGLVYITNFFEEGGDFLFFVKGYKNLTEFLKLTFSGKAYDEPCFATPLQLFSFKKLIATPGLDCLQFECVGKTETKGLRWKYLYKSAVNAWDKLEYDQQKYDAIKARVARPGPLVEDLSDTEEYTSTEDEDDETDDETDDDDEDDEDDGDDD